MGFQHLPPSRRKKTASKGGRVGSSNLSAAERAERARKAAAARWAKDEALRGTK